MTAPLLKLSPARAMWTVTWPMVALGLVKSCYFLTDVYWVGKLGDDALIALGGVAFAWWMVLLAGELAGTGVHALVARHEGAGRPERIPGTTAQGLWVALAVAALLGLLLPVHALYFDVLGFMPGSAESRLGSAYLFACLLGAGSFAVHAALGGVFRGLGDTRTALYITVVTLVVNVVLDPLLIWGPGPLPELGIAGAAWATSIANGVGAACGWWALRRKGHAMALAPPLWAAMTEIVRIGAPVSARGIAFSLVYVVLGRFINHFDTLQMAALGVGHRIESFPFMICVGFEVGAATLVGQHLGAGDEAGARHSIRVAVQMCVAAMIPMSLALYVFAVPLFALFADQPDTIEYGAIYLRIQTLVFVFMALEAVYEGGFTGAGDTMPAFWIGAIGTFARIPIAWWLAWPMGYGVVGIWYAVAGTTALKGLVMWAGFARLDLSRYRRRTGAEEPPHEPERPSPQAR